MATPEEGMRITVLGTRGSCATGGARYSRFGGNTSCYLVEAAIFLDAGSGLANAGTHFGRAPHILLSHLHVDHLLGLGAYGRLSQPGALTHLHVPAASDVEAGELVARLYSPPLWPIGLADYAGNLRVHAMGRAFRIGDVKVDTMPGNHPGGCLAIRLRLGRKTLVYATDFEHGQEATARLTDFSRGADLVLYDGQYGEEEYTTHRGFGHSTPEAGMGLVERCGARGLLVVHHDPHADDETLLAREGALGRDSVRFAREGEVIEL